ncbi:hypothetical protein [Sphingomonas nostoxanthinifaciens]|uniref:hypothetical protein n=1 Tax=Sphingomonas nostoxanthinifaciens TaxID=2872652 RepID=UPI001CC2040B|nr:hypothetical protein [Sphingomonas nostoxanthinifaciens]
MLVVAACVPPAKPPPKHVAPPPKAAPAPVPPTPAQTDWRDIPLTPGTWRYMPGSDGSSAGYGAAGAALFTIRCRPATHEIVLARPTATAGPMTVRTSYAERTIATRAGTGGVAEATLAARDPFLDQIAFSRGRVSIALAGTPTLYLPAWAEPARVIEDCR